MEAAIVPASLKTTVFRVLDIVEAREFDRQFANRKAGHQHLGDTHIFGMDEAKRNSANINSRFICGIGLQPVIGCSFWWIIHDRLEAYPT